MVGIYKAASLIYNTYRYFVISRIASRKLSMLASSCGDDPECIVRIAFSFEYIDPLAKRRISIKPIQIFEEILEFSRIVRDLKPRNILEIGTAGGGTLFIWSRISREDAKIISIDLPGGSFGGGYSRWRIPLYRSFTREGQKLYLLRRDSHSIETLDIVKKILDKDRLDMLFIDGDHSYEGVKKDFEMYSPLVREGGIIAFHDIVPHPPETGCEVSRLWDEIKNKYKYLEIVRDWNQKWAGIGVLYV